VLEDQISVLNAERAAQPQERAVRRAWHVITGEYPPQAGGVSDYTYGVTAGLAAGGDEVHVWCPACPGKQAAPPGVAIHRRLGALTPGDLRRADRDLDAFPAPRRLLVQWVPHSYGYRSMNLAFCAWVWNRAARHGDHVELMVHEPWLPFQAGKWQQNAAAVVHRLMTILLIRSARRVWVSIPEWEKRWRTYRFGKAVPFEWLPIPSNIPVVNDPAAVEEVRRKYVADGTFLAGHFGTYGRLITSLLEPVLSAMAQEPAAQTVLLMGPGSVEFRQQLVRNKPELASWIHATGLLDAKSVSCHIAACDLLLQPYPDGVSSRRTSSMAGLCHGKPVVTTIGASTEPLWRDSGAAALAPVGDVTVFMDLVRRLRADAVERIRLGRAARNLYQERFDISHTIETLRRSATAPENSSCAF